MKVVFLSVVVCLWFAFEAPGQGTIIWNSPTSPITTNGLGGNGPISGPGNYRFGLYVGALGSPSESLSLVGLATNGLTPGSYVAQNIPVPMPFGSGTIAIQVRGWSAFAGGSYETALSYALGGNTPIAFLGQSPVETYTFGSPTPHRPTAFELTPVPEPSAIGFAILGTIAMLTGVSSRRKRLR